MDQIWKYLHVGKDSDARILHFSTCLTVRLLPRGAGTAGVVRVSEERALWKSCWYDRAPSLRSHLTGCITYVLIVTYFTLSPSTRGFGVGLDRGAFHPSIQPVALLWWVRSSKGGRSLRSWSMRHNFLPVVPDVEGSRVYKSFPRLLNSYFCA